LARKQECLTPRSISFTENIEQLTTKEKDIEYSNQFRFRDGRFEGEIKSDLDVG
jgi:hypothetical protein